MLFIVFAAILDIIALYLIFSCRKAAEKSLKWAIIVLLLPVLGFILYIFLGYHRHFQTSPHLAYADEYKAELQEQIARLNDSGQEYSKLKLYNIQEGNALLMSAVSLQALNGGRDKYAALSQDISNAQHHIHLLYYIFENDSIGAGFIELLCEKARQGVEVKLLYDPWGNHTDIKELFAKLRAAGGEVLAYAPVWGKDFIRFNYRNHRKIAVIDGVCGYMGGMNISKNYAEMGKIKPWRDMHIRLTGEAVKCLQLRFFMDWAYASNTPCLRDKQYYPKLTVKGNINMQIIAAGPDTESRPIRGGFLKMIKTARHSLYMASGYFIPDKELLNAICAAAQRGVEVKLLLSRVSDHYSLYAAAATYLPKLIKSGVKVYYYEGYVHSKLLLIDEQISNIGTANLDIRSFFDNFELTAVIYDSQFTEGQYAFFNKELDNAKLQSLKDIESRSIKDKLTGYIMRLFTPLL